MNIYFNEMTLQTGEGIQIYNLMDSLNEEVAKSGIKEGLSIPPSSLTNVHKPKTINLQTRKRTPYNGKTAQLAKPHNELPQNQTN